MHKLSLLIRRYRMTRRSRRLTREAIDAYIALGEARALERLGAGS